MCLSVYALQFHRQSDAYKNALKYMNMCFTGMFTVECILKIAAFGVRVSSTIPTNPICSSTEQIIKRTYSLRIIGWNARSLRAGFPSKNDVCDIFPAIFAQTFARSRKKSKPNKEFTSVDSRRISFRSRLVSFAS